MLRKKKIPIVRKGSYLLQRIKHDGKRETGDLGLT